MRTTGEKGVALESRGAEFAVAKWWTELMEDWEVRSGRGVALELLRSEPSYAMLNWGRIEEVKKSSIGSILETNSDVMTQL